jgi:hypothetical protein
MSKTQRVINFSKVQWADYWYEQQDGITSRVMPRMITVRGIEVASMGVAASHHDYPHETMYERAARLGIVDIWTPVCSLIINANKSLHYRGEQATKIWNTYKAHTYGN